MYILSCWYYIDKYHFLCNRLFGNLQYYAKQLWIILIEHMSLTIIHTIPSVSVLVDCVVVNIVLYKSRCFAPVVVFLQCHIHKSCRKGILFLLILIFIFKYVHLICSFVNLEVFKDRHIVSVGVKSVQWILENLKRPMFFTYRVLVQALFTVTDKMGYQYQCLLTIQLLFLNVVCNLSLNFRLCLHCPFAFN